MLTDYPLNGFLRITDRERARYFYEQVLDLTFEYENPYVSDHAYAPLKVGSLIYSANEWLQGLSAGRYDPNSPLASSG